MSRNSDYWKKRTEENLKNQYKKADSLEKELKLEYEKALVEINKQISSFYLRFANDNGMSYTEAVQQLRGKEFNQWKKSLNGYIKEIEATGNERLLLELNTLAMKSRINRLDSLMVDIQMELAKLYGYENVKAEDLLGDVAKDTYYKTIYNVQISKGIGYSFGKLDNRTIDEILNHPWSGDNYSNRIWRQKDKLVNSLKQELTQKFIQGKDVKTTAKAIAEKMNVSYRNAATLVQTETSYIIGESTARGYKETGVQKYEILATLDNKTSNICRNQDGKIYSLDERMIGINYPPFHIRCRTTTVPYFDDDKGERAARSSNGKTYYVPSDMKYQEWYSKYVDEGSNKKETKEEKSWHDFKEDNKTFNNKNEIKKHLDNEYGIKFSDSRKNPIHKDLLEASVNWMNKFHKYFDGFKSIDPVNLPALNIKASMKPVGSYRYYRSKPEAVEINLNGEFFTDKEYNNKYVQHCIDTKWTVANAKGHKTFVHEYGHHIADSLKWLDKADGEVNQEWCKDFIDDVIKDYNTKYNTNIEFKDMSDLVGRYGGSKPEETFAETFAEYFGGENPRKFAEVFGKKVELKLKEHINKKR